MKSILNKRLYDLEIDISKKCKRPYVRKRIKFGPFHFYRKIGAMKMNFNFFFKEDTKWEGVTFAEWEYKIKKIVPLQFFFRYELIPFIEDWTFLFYVDSLPTIRNLENSSQRKLNPWQYITNIHINPDCELYKLFYSTKIYIKDILFPHNVLKISGIKRSWIDADAKLIYAMRQIILDFVEKEEPRKPEDYEPDICKNEHGVEVDYSIQRKEDSKRLWNLYYWFKDYPEKLKECWDKQSSIPYGKSRTHPDTSGAWEKRDEIEKEFENELEEKLIELIKIRKHLWS